MSVDKPAIDRLRALLIDSVCTDSKYQSGYLLLLFESCQVTVGSAWRLASEGQILAGNDSKETVLAEVPKVLIGDGVRTVDTYGSFHDLWMQFSMGTILETFANAEGYEHWYVRGGIDWEEMIIAGPGTLWSRF